MSLFTVNNSAVSICLITEALVVWAYVWSPSSVDVMLEVKIGKELQLLYFILFYFNFIILFYFIFKAYISIPQLALKGYVVKHKLPFLPPYSVQGVYTWILLPATLQISMYVHWVCSIGIWKSSGLFRLICRRRLILPLCSDEYLNSKSHVINKNGEDFHDWPNNSSQSHKNSKSSKRGYLPEIPL